MERYDNQISKGELKEIVLSCDRLRSHIASTNLTIHMKYKQIEDVVHAIIDIECVFAYLYAEVANYGNVTDVLNTKSDVYARYTLAASLVFSRPNAIYDSIEKIPKVWSHVRLFLHNINAQEHPTSEATNKDVDALDDAIPRIAALQ